MNINTVIEAEGLTQVFPVRGGSLTAVNSINLTVAEGEIIALLGPNGAGKTTLIDMILGFTTPTSGTLTVTGTSAQKAARTGHLGAVQQSGGLLKTMTVRQTIESVAALYQQSISVAEVLEGADLAEIAERKVGKCSGGQQQRLRFALATLHKPQILILDEPTASMDVTARRAFWGRIGALAESGTTIIFATHYLEEAQEFARRIILMQSGTIIADGTSEQIRDLTGYRTISFLSDAPLIFPKNPQLPVEVTAESGKYRHRLSVADAEGFTRTLLNQHTVNDLEIVKPSLDESFILLTGS